MKHVASIPLFSSPIFIFNLDVEENKILNFLKKLKYSPLISEEIKDCFISQEGKILEKNFKEIKKLKKEVNKSLSFLINEIFNYEGSPYVFNSWGTKTLVNGYSGQHIHANTWLSGVYYPEENLDFKITFYSDRMLNFSGKINNKGYNLFNSAFHYVCPKKNDLILFASNLQHKININKSKKERYSIAFNVLPKGNFGDGDSFINFKF
jgi:uncharacterized protein (TIGR02466 family)